MKSHLVLAMAAIAISGCISTGGPGNASQGQDDGIVIITDPGDFEASQTPGIHVHNYWGGSDRITVFDSTETLVVAGSTVCPGSLNPVEQNCIELDPLDDGMVAPGTRAIEFLADWPADANGIYGYVRVYYEAPNSTGGFSKGEFELRPSEASDLDITRDLQDLPHTQQTRWRIWISLAATTPGSYNVDFTATGRRQEGNISPAPAHPDHWGNETMLTLNEFSSGYAEVLGQPDVPGMGEYPGSRVIPEAGVIVAPLARIVTVDAYLNFTSPEETAPNPLLSFHGADQRTNEVEGMMPTSVDQSSGFRHWTWELDVEARMWDSPYAVDTSWGIFINWNGDVSAAAPTYTQGTVDIQVAAQRGP